MNGKDPINTPQVEAGDIGALTKLAGGPRLGIRSAIEMPRFNFQVSSSRILTSLMPFARRAKATIEKLMTSLTRMSEEDPTFRIERNEVTKQLLISGLGDLHININRERMADKFGVETEVSPPKVPYRETNSSHCSEHPRQTQTPIRWKRTVRRCHD